MYTNGAGITAVAGTRLPLYSFFTKPELINSSQSLLYLSSISNYIV